MLTISLIGRYNVGKTILFNKLSGKSIGISLDHPGLTRDRNESIIQINNQDVRLIDTPGIDAGKIEIEKDMMDQSIAAIKISDILFFILDGKTGITKEDLSAINTVRKFDKPCYFIVNKCENTKPSEKEMHGINYKELIFISAEHNINLHEIKKIIKENLIEQKETKKTTKETKKTIKITIVGRPNAGKSTFINSVIKENRLLVSDIAGTTRDSILIHHKYKDYEIELFDTAGLRKKSTTKGNTIETLSVEQTLDAINLSNVVVLLMDVENAFEDQDLQIARQVILEGRILMIAINKWDKVDSKIGGGLLKTINTTIASKITEIKKPSFFTLSAIKESNFEKILDEAILLYNKWNYKIPARSLKSLADEINSKNLSKGGKKIKVFYINQKKARPPSFLIKTNMIEKEIPSHYISFIRNKIIERFDLYGITIRLDFTKQND